VLKLWQSYVPLTFVLKLWQCYVPLIFVLKLWQSYVPLTFVFKLWQNYVPLTFVLKRWLILLATFTDNLHMLGEQIYTSSSFQLQLKGLLIGSSISILTSESYYYARGCEMTQVACVKHGSCVRYLRPFDG